jgi:sterol desaturase/sphingolipid hydroxylase (fatty acid hydroxylase superfamily)
VSLLGPYRLVVESLTPYSLAVNAPYVVAFTAVATGVTWRATRDPQRRRQHLTSAATATAMAAGALVVGIGYAAALRLLWDAAAGFRWEAAARFWAARPVLGAVAAFVAWDLAGWLYHLVGHRTAVGWAAHQPHHSGESYDLTLGLRQSWTPFCGLAFQPLLALAGFDLRVIYVCAALSNCWQVLAHTAVAVPVPRWVGAVVTTPATHRHHHARHGAPVNLGPVLTVWDRLSGTWVGPDTPPPAAYGPVVPASANPVRVELAGWAALLGRRAGSRPGRGPTVRRDRSPADAPGPQRPTVLPAGLVDADHGQADHVRVAALDPVHEQRGRSLDPVPAGLVGALPGGHVPGHVVVVDGPEPHPGHGDRLHHPVVEHDRHRRDHLVVPAGQPTQHGGPVAFVDRLAQGPAVDDDHRVGADHQLTGAGHGPGLGCRQALGQPGPVLTGPGRLVDPSRADHRVHPDRRQQLDPPGRGGSQDQRGAGHRSTLGPGRRRVEHRTGTVPDSGHEPGPSRPA